MLDLLLFSQYFLKHNPTSEYGQSKAYNIQLYMDNNNQDSVFSLSGGNR